MGFRNFTVSVRDFPMKRINCLKSCLRDGIETSSETTPRVKVLCRKIKLHFSKSLVLSMFLILMLKTISGQFMFLILLLQTELDQNQLPLEMPNNIVESNLGTGSLGRPKEWLAQCCLLRPAVSSPHNKRQPRFLCCPWTLEKQPGLVLQRPNTEWSRGQSRPH